MTGSFGRRPFEWPRRRFLADAGLRDEGPNAHQSTLRNPCGAITRLPSADHDARWLLASWPAFYAVLGAVSRPAFVRKRLVGLFCPPSAAASYRARVLETRADPGRWARTLRTARGEGAGLRVSRAALRTDCGELPPVPVRVLTARHSGAGAKSAQRVHEAWEAMVARGLHARLTKVPSSGHHLPVEAPDVVTKAILELLDAIDSPQPRA